MVFSVFCKAKSAGKKTIFFSLAILDHFKKKCSNMRPLLFITFPQGFRTSKNIRHWTLGSWGNKMFKQYLKMNRRTHGRTHRRTHGWTHRQTHRRTNQLIESIGPEGQCFENLLLAVIQITLYLYSFFKVY